MPGTFTPHRQDIASADDGDGTGETQSCAYVRDTCAHARDATASGVLGEDDIRQLSRHAAHCLACMQEFVGLIKATASATAPTAARASGDEGLQDA